MEKAMRFGTGRVRRGRGEAMTRVALVAGAALASLFPGIAGGAPASAAGGLAGTSWRLVEFRSMDDAVGVVRPDNPSLYTMSLDGDGTVSMRLNCNRARGTWSAEPAGDGSSGRFEFGPLAATRALCPPPSMDETIVAQARHLRSYTLSEGRLYLSLMADAGIYAWEPHEPEGAPAAGPSKAGAGEATAVPAAPEDGGPRNWKVTRPLNLRESRSTDSAVVALLAPGRILDNMGCQAAEGRIWCYVQPLGGGPVGFVAAEFLRPAVSPDGSVATGPDDSALRAGKGDFDATGKIPCAQHRGQPLTECGFGVARAGGGYATVVVEKPGGGTRAIFFRMGTPIGADTSQADGYGEFRAEKEGDLNLIGVGEERYEIPDAVVLGG